MERIHRTLISVLTKFSLEKPALWYTLVRKVQKALNSTYQRSVNTTPYEVMFGIKMKRKEDIALPELLHQEERNSFIEDREQLRVNAKKQMLDIHEENRRNFNKKRQKSNVYKKDDLVCIRRTQFGTGMKLKSKYLGPYKVTKVKRNNR